MVSDKPLIEAVVSAPPFVVAADAPGNSDGVVDAGCEAGVLPRVSDPPDNLKTGLGSNLTAASLLSVSERSENSVDAVSVFEVGFPRVASCPALMQLCNQQTDQPPVPSAGCNPVQTSVVSDGNTVAPFPSVREVFGLPLLGAPAEDCNEEYVVDHLRAVMDAVGVLDFWPRAFIGAASEQRSIQTSGNANVALFVPTPINRSAYIAQQGIESQAAHIPWAGRIDSKTQVIRIRRTGQQQ
ncbi:hypothetical protein Nepgr_031753 [Nepenthes gracilis]|uniref:Uncharacterized protein n=1 Tax=Nepenthes gracilis TaxID=150966 RepID=A0AAD3Y747_NEPGR|nr:hypothetical protein Nepgr_031753 [Nepenthes gracilis]